MRNERKTEAIIRSHFEKFSDVLNIEEQISDNPRIEKLLKISIQKGAR